MTANFLSKNFGTRGPGPYGSWWRPRLWCLSLTSLTDGRSVRKRVGLFCYSVLTNKQRGFYSTQSMQRKKLDTVSI